MSFRRRMMMAVNANSGGLPSGYTAFDWVECSNPEKPAIINTGLYLEMNNYYDRWEAEGKFARNGNALSNYAANTIFTNTNSNNDAGFTIRRSSNKSDKICYTNHTYFGGQALSIRDEIIKNGEWHTFKLTYIDANTSGGKLILDGVSTQYTATKGNYTNKPLYILGFPSSYCFPCRLAELFVYRYGQLVADFVPAMKNSNNIIGFYDVVRNVFCEPTNEDAQIVGGYGFENFS